MHTWIFSYVDFFVCTFIAGVIFGRRTFLFGFTQGCFNYSFGRTFFCATCYDIPTLV